MGVVSNIVEALRRIGSPTVKSALKRQDDFLSGKEILERKQVHIAGPKGPVQGLVATVAPIAESIERLSVDDIRPIRENAEYGRNFLRAFGVREDAHWGLADLDAAFSSWQGASDRLGFTDDYVVEVLGAMFGEYCNTHLKMRWVRVTDEFGTAIGIEGVERQFRGFPYDTISKRIRDSEHGFFEPVFLLLRNQSNDAANQGDVA